MDGFEFPVDHAVLFAPPVPKLVCAPGSGVTKLEPPELPDDVKKIILNVVSLHRNGILQSDLIDSLQTVVGKDMAMQFRFKDWEEIINWIKDSGEIVSVTFHTSTSTEPVERLFVPTELDFEDDEFMGMKMLWNPRSLVVFDMDEQKVLDIFPDSEEFLTEDCPAFEDGKPNSDSEYIEVRVNSPILLTPSESRRRTTRPDARNFGAPRSKANGRRQSERLAVKRCIDFSQDEEDGLVDFGPKSKKSVPADQDEDWIASSDSEDDDDVDDDDDEDYEDDGWKKTQVRRRSKTIRNVRKLVRKSVKQDDETAGTTRTREERKRFVYDNAEVMHNWLIQHYEADEEGTTKRWDMYYHYMNTYCAHNKSKPVNSATFGKIVRTVFPEVSTRRLGSRGMSRYHYTGIVMKETSPLIDVDVGEEVHKPDVLRRETRSRLDASYEDRPPSFHLEWLTSNFKISEPAQYVKREFMFDKYLQYCDESKVHPLNQAGFGKIVRRGFNGVETRRLGNRGHSRYYYTGIEVKPMSSIYDEFLQILNNTDENVGSSTQVPKRGKRCGRRRAGTKKIVAPGSLTETIEGVIADCRAYADDQDEVEMGTFLDVGSLQVNT